MIHNIEKPIISADFTIDDIHKLRAWNYECLKDATVEERLAATHKRAAEGLRRLMSLRRTKHATSG
jgi:hypothetical protein